MPDGDSLEASDQKNPPGGPAENVFEQMRKRIRKKRRDFSEEADPKDDSTGLPETDNEDTIFEKAAKQLAARATEIFNNQKALEHIDDPNDGFVFHGEKDDDITVLPLTRVNRENDMTESEFPDVKKIYDRIQVPTNHFLAGDQLRGGQDRIPNLNYQAFIFSDTGYNAVICTYTNHANDPARGEYLGEAHDGKIYYYKKPTTFLELEYASSLIHSITEELAKDEINES